MKNFRSVAAILSFFVSATILSNFSITQTAHAAPKPLVSEKQLAASTSKIEIKINKPKAPKGALLDGSLQLKGCWLNDGLSGVSAKDKNKKKLKFSLSKDKSVLELKKQKGVKFPISLTLNFKDERTTVAKGSALIVNGKTKCETVKKKDGKTKQDCSLSQPIDVRANFSGVSCSVASDFPVGASDAVLVFADGDALTVRDSSKPLRFALQGGAFLEDLTDATAIINDEVITVPNLQLSGGILEVTSPLIDGRNIAEIRALDSAGLQIGGSFEFWAGANELVVNLVNQTGGAATSGKLSVTIADDPKFQVLTNYSNGQAVIQTLPGTTLSILAEGDDGSSGFIAGAGTDRSVTVTMIPPLDENAITTNTAFEGWEPGSSRVTLIDHTEDEPVIAASKDAEIAEVGPDRDVVIVTDGQGTRFMMKTFRTDPKSRLVRIRYRFQTNEYPGGYFGSKYNDFYNVSLRSSSGASILDDGSSMNALGRGAFSPAGFTVWKSTVIPVNRIKKATGDVVQALVSVANVADGAFDSRVVVDSVEESSFAITEGQVFDIDNSELKFLSAAGHTYFEGFTHINGTIALEGDEDDKISEIYLQLMDEGKEVGKAQLSTQAAQKLYGKKFGKTGKILIKSPILLFKIFPNTLTGLTPETDKSYSLVIQATSSKGAKAHKTLSTVSALVKYTGAARYDGRDETSGGDDWLLPSIKTKVDNYASITWGDFSNMNGGKFPPHDLHQLGRSADGWIAGYNSLDENTVSALTDLLNSGLGSQIRFMYVAYRRSPGNAFYRAMQGKKLNNGRKLENVILPDGQHTTHFHLEF